MPEENIITSDDVKEIKELGQKQSEAVKALREAHDELEKKAGSFDQEKFNKATEALESMETKNQEFAKKFEQQEVDKKELDEKLEEMEKKMFRLKKKGIDTEEESEAAKICKQMLRFGESKHNDNGITTDQFKTMMDSEQVKLLRTDASADGGVLVIPEVAMEIIKPITEISGMRQVARVMNTSSKSVIINKRIKLLNGGWVGERKIAPSDSSQYGEEEIPVNKLMVEVIATTEMIQDSWANVVQEITQDAGEDFAQLEGAAFVNGDGVKKPKGFTNDTGIQRVKTENASNLTADSIIVMAGELKTGYNARYLLNRRTIARTRLLKDDEGRYLWQPGLDAGNPNTLNGDPYVEMPDMDDVAAGKLPIAYGDFMRGYRIVDHSAMSVIRDEFTLAREGKVSWVFIRRVGGQVVLQEAIKLLEVGTS